MVPRENAWAVRFWAAALGSLAGLGSARAAPPCAEAARDPGLAPLARALERPETWRTALDSVAPGSGPGTGAPLGQAACRHYLAGAAAFFLSERSAELAPRAVEHLLAAHLLDPAAMDHVQARSRLRTAFLRLGDVPGLRTSGAPATVEFVPTGPPLPFVLRPTEALAPTWQLPAPPSTTPAGAGRLPLPPGRYRATVNGRCGGSDIDFTVATGLGRVVLPTAPPCTVHLLAVGATGEPLPEARVIGPEGAAVDPAQVPAGAGEAVVSAPGYRPRTVPLAELSGRSVVPLERCPVDLRVAVTPGDATIDGAGPGPWGPRPVALRRTGYASTTLEIEVPAPPSCDGAVHDVEVRLTRPVRFSARADDGSEVVPAWRLDGREIATAGLTLEPGTYAYEARLPAVPPVSGRLQVPPCALADCPPVALDVVFGTKPSGSSRLGPWLVLGAGGVALGGGVLAGAAALAVQTDIDAYTTRRAEAEPLDTLVERRDERARTADALFAAGTTLAVGALLWLWLGDE